MTSPTAPVDQLNNEIARHGDFVQDVAFEVDDILLIIEVWLSDLQANIQVFQNVKRNGLKVLQEPETSRDEFGSIVLGRICGSAGSILHTLIQRCDYNGIFLPGYTPIDPIEFCARQ